MKDRPGMYPTSPYYDPTIDHAVKVHAKHPITEPDPEKDPEITRELVDRLFDSDDRKLIKLRYGPGESGWAIEVPNSRLAIIANIPIEGRLRIKDVVRRDPPADCSYCGTAGEVVFRYYSQTTGVRYPKDNPGKAREIYATIWEACHDQGIRCEGFTIGLAAINHHEDTDLVSILTAAGLDMSKITLCTDKDDSNG